MNKLDKEALSKKYYISNEEMTPVIRSSYEDGLEYAENHYLKLIEEKDKEIERLNEDSTNAILQHLKSLHTAKELLKELIEFAPSYQREIGEFLKQ